MRPRQSLVFRTSLTLFLASAALAGVLSLPAHAQKRIITRSATTFPKTGYYTPAGVRPATRARFPGQVDNPDGSPGPWPGMVVNRTLGHGPGNGPPVRSGKKAKSRPVVNVSFEGINTYQSRFVRGGNALTMEPPDQGLCVGNGFVVEAVNSALNIYNTSGQSVLPDNTATNIVKGYPRDVNHAIDLNSFFGYAPAIDSATGVRGPFLTDPSCLYDAATNRFFVVALVLEARPDGPFTGVNHLDIAVSQTGDPTGGWNIYRVDTTNDGTSPSGPPYLGDQPRIGADANGFYISTNAYEFFTSIHAGAQIYAFSKAQLVAGAANLTMLRFDTTQMVTLHPSPNATVRQKGFSVVPAQSPGANSYNLNDGGTEYFLSSNAQFSRSHTSPYLILWSLTNTSTLNSGSPALRLTNTVLTVDRYGYPPEQRQPGSGTPTTTDTPLGYALNDTATPLTDGTVGGWRLPALYVEPAHDEVISHPYSNDSRMQQVMYANGKLWGALGTALRPDGGSTRAGIAWYILNPASARVSMQGYLGTSGYDLTYPAIGVTESGRGVIAFTATGDDLYPSAAYAPIDAIVGVGSWDIVPGGEGAAPDDGFTGYKAWGVPVRARWGDYGAAAVDGNTIWIASEYIAHPLSFTEWGGPSLLGGIGDNIIGTGGGESHGPGVRTAIGNWSTRISQVTP